MTKKLDWNAVKLPTFEERHRVDAKGDPIPTYKEQVAKSLRKMQQQEDAENLRKAQEPILKSHLLDHMVNRKPLAVMRDIQNPTEGMGGVDSNGDDDGFYTSGSTNPMSASFEETMEIIPAGTELTFVALNKSLGQWIFKSSQGKEYAIYDKPKIMFKGNAIENPGFFGLLYNTNIVEKL